MVTVEISWEWQAMEFSSSEKRKRVFVDEKMSPVEKPCRKKGAETFQ